MFDIHFTPEPPLAGVADDGWAERIAVPDPVVEPQFYGGPPPTQVDERLDAEARHVHLLRALGLRPAPGSNTAVAMEPGPRLIQLLTDIPLGTVSTGVRVAWLVAWQCCQGWVEAQAQAAIAVTAGPEPVADTVLIPGVTDAQQRTAQLGEPVAAELSAALRLAPLTAQRAVELARDLAGPWRPLRDALEAGQITLAHVRVVREHLERLPRDTDPDGDDVYADLCAAVLPEIIGYAAAHTPGQSGRYARGVIERTDIDGLADRRRRAKLKADVSVMDDVDDQSVFTVRTDTASAHALLAAVDSLAKDPRFTPVDCPRISQRRAAAAVTLILANVPGGQGVLDYSNPTSPRALEPWAAADLTAAVQDARINAHVNVVVSLDTLLALSPQPGTVAGVPVAADAILDLIAASGPRSTLRRLVTDPTTGHLLDTGRRSYKISERMRRFITTRDGSCRFPGCTRNAQACQLDHADPFNTGGLTTKANLGSLCLKHHQLKTFTTWEITTSRDDGTCTWKSPQLRKYEHKPPPLLPPPRPPGDNDHPPF